MSGLRDVTLTLRFLCELAMPVPIPTRVAIELVLFGAAAGALAVAGQPLAAVVLGVAALASSLLNATVQKELVGSSG